ncbi:hypothetical protein [Vibrio hepatarius]|uniref:hypothetical protein n=1 Tax=Vibrio hepatarius TaxID=171383 RepID=UPI001C099045|nr:hypothetical protein [Vibrio hepatarius]MBU2897294.1 hypothetical protein [Vibrio hepatarius]
MKWTLVLIFALVSCFAAAQPVDDDKADAFINVNMTLELDGIEKALDNTNQSLENIGDALDKIAHSENLTPEQQGVLKQTVESLNQLVDASKQSVESLPSAFQQSKQAIAGQSRLFLDDLQFKVLLTISVIGLLVILIIAAIGWCILRPMQSSLVKASQNMASMAGAIKTTASALDSISLQQHDIAERLEKYQKESLANYEQGKT